jgi:hypothetical protein
MVGINETVEITRLQFFSNQVFSSVFSLFHWRVVNSCIYFFLTPTNIIRQSFCEPFQKKEITRLATYVK